MKTVENINTINYMSDKKIDLLNICNKYNLDSNRIYWDNFTFYLDVFKSEIK